MMNTYFQKIALTICFALGLLAFASAQVPPFSFQTLDGKSFTQENLTDGKSTFIMLFDPGCDHCQEQAKNIGEAAERFGNVQLIFVSMFDDKEGIAHFHETYLGSSKLDVTFLVDPTTGIDFENSFGYTDDPVYIHLFRMVDGKHKYKYFGHEQSAEELLKYL